MFSLSKNHHISGCGRCQSGNQQVSPSPRFSVARLGLARCLSRFRGFQRGNRHKLPVILYSMVSRFTGRPSLSTAGPSCRPLKHPRQQRQKHQAKQHQHQRAAATTAAGHKRPPAPGPAPHRIPWSIKPPPIPWTPKHVSPPGSTASRAAGPYMSLSGFTTKAALCSSEAPSCTSFVTWLSYAGPPENARAAS